MKRAGGHKKASPAKIGTMAAPLRLSGSVKNVSDIARDRLVMLAALFAFAFIVLSVRVVQIAVLGGDGGLSAYASTQQASGLRADIVDRRGNVLATNLETYSVHVDPQRIMDVEDAARAIAGVLPELSLPWLRKRLTASGRFQWIKRHITPAQRSALLELGIPALEFKQEQVRVYPHGALFSHVVGEANLDGKGISGVEAFFDESLRVEAKEGSAAPLRLSLDLSVQHAVRQVLSDGMARYKAKAAVGVVLDARSGETLSLVSLPDFDPNEMTSPTMAAKFNRATMGSYEMGSTLKVMTTAMALELGTANLNSTYDATKPLRVGRFRINDDHAQNRVLDVQEILMHSSNIGAALMAAEVGSDAQRTFLGRLGLLRRTSIELPERQIPQLPPRWRSINTMTIAYGHGLAVTPLHVASATAAMGNGGYYVPATLLPSDHVKADGKPFIEQRVISERTSGAMRSLMRLVVEEGTGTAADAAARGYLISGKTGTAEKPVAGGYSDDALLTSFVGLFPAHDPHYVVLVMLDEPKATEETKGYAGAGWNAAPMTGEIVTRIAPLLKIPPVDLEDRDVQAVRAMSVAMSERVAARREADKGRGH